MWWIDFFIIAPVSLFLIWLFWYTAPSGRSRRQGHVDVVVVLVALTGVVGVLAGLHAILPIEGADRHLLAVAGSYVFLVLMLGLGWLRRIWVGRNSNR